MRTVSRCSPNSLETSRMLLPSTITARRTRRYTSTLYIHRTTHKLDLKPMNGGGRSNLQPPFVRDYPPARDNLPPPLTPLMTIHKSKGLEYHTVVFLALDDQAWWSFKNQPEEGKATFFVAFSRAKRKVVFTYCEGRGDRRNISSLYDILEFAGVPSRFVA